MEELKSIAIEGLQIDLLNYEVTYSNGKLNLSKKLSIMERVRTYADALRELNLKESDLWFYNLRVPLHVVAQAMLEIIISALNEGWVPDMANFDEMKYYPYFSIVKDKYKTEHSDSNSRSDTDASCGLACSTSLTARTFWAPNYVARLALKNRELAEYAGRQFIQLYEEVLLIK